MTGVALISGKGLVFPFAYFGIDRLPRRIYHRTGHSTRDFEIAFFVKEALLAFG